MKMKSFDILNEISNYFERYEYYITDFDNNNVDPKQFDEFRVVVENPYNKENLYIDIMYGEITVFFGMHHTHYYLEWMYQDLLDFLGEFFQDDYSFANLIY